MAGGAPFMSSKVIAFVLVLENYTNASKEFNFYQELKDAGAADDDKITEIAISPNDAKQFSNPLSIIHMDHLGSSTREDIPVHKHIPAHQLQQNMATIPMAIIIGQANSSKYTVIPHCRVEMTVACTAGVGIREKKNKEEDEQKRIHDELSSIPLE